MADSVPILYSKVPSGLDSPNSNELVNPDRIKILPVTPKLAIALCRKNAFEDAPAGKLVEAVNTTMFNECLAVAAHERNTIQSLLSSPNTIKTHEETLEYTPIRFHLNGQLPKQRSNQCYKGRVERASDPEFCHEICSPRPRLQRQKQYEHAIVHQSHD